MIHDLLYRIKEEVDPQDDLLADNLMIRSIFSPYIADTEKLDNILRIVCSPLKLQDNIIHRRQIFTDFFDSEFLLSKITNVFDRIRMLYTKINSIKVHRVAPSPLTLIEMRAETFKMTIELFYELSQYVKDVSPKSQPLIDLVNRIKNIGEYNNNYIELLQFLDKVRSLSIANKPCVELSLNEHGKVEFCEFCDTFIDWMSVTDKKEYANMDTVNHVPTPLNALAQNNSETLYKVALNSLAEAIYDAEKSIFTEFMTAVDQIDFYIAAVGFFKSIQEKGVNWCFAEIGKDNTINIERLCDPILCIKGINPTSNDFYCDCDTSGIVISGANNSGKTVFLRSLSLAMIMAWQGLPILAQSAIIPQRNAMYSLFASSERSLAQNMGRFEQEVERLATIIDSITSDQILIMNEPFQTTEYTEGAIGLYGILEYLSDINVFWIVVTHLDELKLLAKSNDRIATFNMTDEHKLTQE